MDHKLTWSLVGDGGGAAKVARPGGPMVALVVAVDGVRGVRGLGVGLEARGAGLDGAAVGAVAARVVQPRLQPRVPDRGVRHAPACRRCPATCVCSEETMENAPSDQSQVTDDNNILL